MPLKKDEIAELKGFLADNRENHPSGQDTLGLVNEPTDHTRVMVPKASSSNRRKFHLYADGEPACGGSTRCDVEDYRPWPKIVAIEWMKPCNVCYNHYDVKRGLDEDVELEYGEPGSQPGSRSH